MNRRNRQLLEELCAERFGDLLALATLVSASPSSARDLVDHAIAASFARLRHFRSLDEADASVRRHILNRTVKASSSPPVHGDEPLVERTDGDGAYAAVDPQLWSALRVLGARERVCVVLRFVEKLSVPQAAALLGWSETEVERAAADGIESLSRALDTAIPAEWPELAAVSNKRGTR